MLEPPGFLVLPGHPCPPTFTRVPGIRVRGSILLQEPCPAHPSPCWLPPQTPCTGGCQAPLEGALFPRAGWEGLWGDTCISVREAGEAGEGVQCDPQGCSSSSRLPWRCWELGKGLGEGGHRAQGLGWAERGKQAQGVARDPGCSPGAGGIRRQGQSLGAVGRPPC